MFSRRGFIALNFITSAALNDSSLPPVGFRATLYFAGNELEEASTHKSANKTTPVLFLCLVTFAFDLLTPINGFPGVMMEYFYVKLGDPIAAAFLPRDAILARYTQTTP